MTFLVGKTYRTRGGGWATVAKFIEDSDHGDFLADHDNGQCFHHRANGTVYGLSGNFPRDLLASAPSCRENMNDQQT